MPKARLLLSLSDEEIVEMIRKHRWPEGVTCIYCGSKHVVRNGKSREKPYVQRYMCRDCGKQFNDLTGTPFSHTSLSPREVLTIAYLYFKLGMSALAITREVGRSRKAVERVIRLYGEHIEAYFRSAEARRRSRSR